MWKRYTAATILAATLIALLLTQSETGGVVAALRQARWPLLLVSLGLGFLTIFLKAIRWSFAIAAAGGVRPHKRLFSAAVLGTAGNSILPARLGDVLRSLLLSKHNGTQIGRALIAEWAVLCMDLVFLCLLLLVGAGAAGGLTRTPILVTTLTAAVCAFVGLRWIAQRPAQISARLALLPGRFGSFIRKQSASALDGIQFLRSPKTLCAVLAFTVAIWGLEISLIAIALSAFGISPTVPATALLVAALGVSFALPITPGNVGTYQLVTVFVLGRFGVAETASLAFGIGYQSFTLVCVLVVATVIFVREGLDFGFLSQTNTTTD